MIQSRRGFLKTAAIGATGIAGLTLLGGCGTSQNGPAKNDSEKDVDGNFFIGEGRGAKGDLSAIVVIEDGKIVTVAPGPNEESEGPGQFALKTISNRVLEAQSTRIDAITGATLTSMGYIDAIKNAIEDAGMASDFDKEVEVEKVEYENKDYDVVIVGSGASGLMAALTLISPNYDGNKSDLKVLVLEKMDVVGGTSLVSHGGVACADGIKSNDAAGYHTPTEDMVNMLRQRNTKEVNEPLARAVIEKFPVVLSNVNGLGGPYATGLAGRPRTYNGIWYLQIDAQTNLLLSDFPTSANSFTNQGGYRITYFLETKLRQLGGEIRTGSKVTKLINNGGAVTGVQVTEGDNVYDVNAKKVILASGGFAQNKELMDELVGDLIPHYFPFCGAGSTGDAFALTEELGTTRVGEGAFVYFSLTDQGYGMLNELNNAFRRREAVFVNDEGKRFIDETSDEYYVGYAISQTNDGHAFVIIDSDSPDVEIFERWIDRGMVKKADTLDALAEEVGIPAAAFNETIDAYNSAFDAGTSPEFDTPIDKMKPVKKGPFYAGEVTTCLIGTLVGLKVNENCQILGTGDAPIENLYGVGEVCLGGNILSKYYAAGFSVGTALSSGAIAAEHAKANL